MNLKRFRVICNVASIILKLLASFCVLILVIGIVMKLSGNPNVNFSVDYQDYSLIFVDDSRISSSTHEFAALITAPIFLSVYAYIYYKGSTLFDSLSNGQTPFTFHFADAVKWISIALILVDVVRPLLYSLLIALRTDVGSFFTFGLTSDFVTGLILYVVSEVLKYGISLQELSDETI